MDRKASQACSLCPTSTQVWLAYGTPNYGWSTAKGFGRYCGLFNCFSKAVPNELDSVTNASFAKVPAVFLTSENDETIPPALQDQVIQEYNGPYRHVVLDGIKHGGDNENSAMRAESYEKVDSAILWLLEEVTQ